MVSSTDELSPERPERIVAQDEALLLKKEGARQNHAVWVGVILSALNISDGDDIGI